MSERTFDFSEIYSEFQPKLYRYFVRVAGEGDAEDLTQETMVKVSRGLDHFRGESSLSTWIYSIATNVARDRFRSAAHRADSVTENADDEDLSVIAGETKAGAGTLEHITVRKEMNT
jgi:RNA polymerase sigma-70 factor (ECF subfamily)